MKYHSLLKSVARSFYLTIWWLPDSIREPVALAYLLARASDTIVDEEDAFLKKSELELIQLLPSLLKELNDPQRDSFDTDAIKVVWQTILKGQQFDLEKQNQVAIFTPSELDRYLYLVAGSVGEFLTRLIAHHLPCFSTESLEKMMVWGVDYGKGLQLINMLRDYQEDHRCGRHYIDEGEQVFYQAQAHFYLQQGELYVKALRPGRFKIACALPLLLGQRTLALIKTHPNTERLKISRWEVYTTLLSALRFSFC